MVFFTLITEYVIIKAAVEFYKKEKIRNKKAAFNQLMPAINFNKKSAWF